MLEVVHAKIFTRESILKQVYVWRMQNHKILFTNGCFDLLHLGHVEYLSRAKDLGGKLIVGLNSDRSIKKIKGPGRPIMDEKSRAMVLASLLFVDALVFFDEETPYMLIRQLEPDILVKGKDYSPEEIVGHDIVKASGGRIVTIELTPGYSTTGIEKKILSSHKS
ncbi:MAG TPA: D-glycero-beta-D-manno-heptose 1-phosphate adenylyltransferase [Bacteroidales bacterium]|nr:D-glycero-beta-D-manno-heptose 1-phosphate adenylyltransferase [Bacteroidales bacterium]